MRRTGEAGAVRMILGSAVAAIALVVAITAGGGGNTTTPERPATTASTAASRPGNASVYTRIASLTDCAQLQREFDLAEATHQRGGTWGPIGTAYMQAADTRMRQVGCY